MRELPSSTNKYKQKFKKSKIFFNLISLQSIIKLLEPITVEWRSSEHLAVKDY